MDWPALDHTQANVLSLPATLLGRKLSFLVDSGAEKSIVPPCNVPSSLLYPCNIVLTGVGGETIPTFGSFSCKLAVPGLRREFPVTFIVAETTAILGADFLTASGLQLDMKRRSLTDSETQISAKLAACSLKTQIRMAGVTNGSSIFGDFPSLVQPPDYGILPNTDVTHSIITEGPPVFSKPRPLSPEKLAVAKREFDALLALKIVRPSNSPWASPLHMVKKVDGSWRPCGDYRRVNAITVPDRYPLPNLQTFHYRLAGSQIFTKLDIVKAYHFIPMAAQDIEKTAICTPFGSFEYLRMPFGLRNSSGTFQRFIDAQLRGLEFALAYVDDILIFSPDAESHAKHVKVVLERLSSVGLRLNEKKCEVAKQCIRFLGYQLNNEGLKPPDDRVEALRSLPEPKDSKELVRTLATFGFYQRCIPSFASIVLPLRDLVANKTFVWNDGHAVAFTALKEALINSATLTFPRVGCHLTITADASSRAIGACLNQVEDGIPKPLSFFSRKLSATEARYSAFDRELLAVFSAVKKWKPLIDCGNVTVFTDHKPLIGAFQNTTPRISDKQQRQLSFISEYVMSMVHISGKDNVVADTLSRAYAVKADDAHQHVVDLPSLAKAQAQNPEEFSQYRPFDIGVKDTVLYCEVSQPNPRPVVPKEQRRDVFNALHSLCHPGIKASVRLLNSRYYWETLKDDVRKWSAECGPCQKSKIGRHTKKPIKDLPYPTQRFTHVHMDIVGPLENPDNNLDSLDNLDGYKPRYLLTIIDSFTRWLEAIPLADISASQVCQAFMLNWVSRFGPPLTLITDKGTQFCSELTARLNDALGINHIRTSAYNPRANGMVERSHRTLKAGLRARGGNWLSQLPVVLFGMRMRPDDDGTCAFSRVTGEQPLVPHIVPSNFDLTQLSIALHKLPFAYTHPRRSTIQDVHLPDKLKRCSHVWLRIDRVKRPLEAPYQGPFEVVDRKADTFSIMVRGKVTSVSVDRLKPAVLPAAAATANGATAEAGADSADANNLRSIEADKQQSTTRSGRHVTFKANPDYHYF